MHVEKCPVCNGNGLVPNGFYRQTSGEWTSSSTVPEMCRSCNGKGWIEVSDIFTLDRSPLASPLHFFSPIPDDRIEPFNCDV